MVNETISLNEKTWDQFLLASVGGCGWSASLKNTACNSRAVLAAVNHQPIRIFEFKIVAPPNV